MTERVRHVPGAIAISSLLLLLTGACGGPASEDRPASGEGAGEQAPPSRSASQDLEVCSLYTRAEAEALLGEPVQDPRTGRETCEYTGESGTAAVGVVVQHIASEAVREERISLLGLEDEGNEAVPGLGDRAFYAGSQLVVFDGPHMMTVTIGLFGARSGERRDSAIAVAETVLSRL